MASILGSHLDLTDLLPAHAVENAELVHTILYIQISMPLRDRTGYHAIIAGHYKDEGGSAFCVAKRKPRVPLEHPITARQGCPAFRRLGTLLTLLILLSMNTRTGGVP